MTSCAAYGCTNSKHTTAKNEDISFHRFPLANKAQCLEWIQVVERKNWTPVESSMLCSKHFAEEDFYSELGVKRLKENVVPRFFTQKSNDKSRFPPTSNICEIDSTEDITEISLLNTEDELEYAVSVIVLNVDDITSTSGAQAIETIETATENNVPLEKSKEHKYDNATIDEIFGNDSVCCERQCNKVIPKEIAEQHRKSFLSLSKKEQDIVILSHLQQHRRVPQLQQMYGAFNSRKKSRCKEPNVILRQNIRYYFLDIQVCKKMYSYVHNLGRRRFERLCEHFDKNGIVPRVHALANKKPFRKSVLEPEDIKSVVSFIESFAKTYGAPLSCRLSKFRNSNVVVLPFSETKTQIYRKYCEYIKSNTNIISVKEIARSTFTKIWNKYCPYITVDCNKKS